MFFVILCALVIYVPSVNTITVDANVLDVQQFTAPAFHTMTDAVENITHLLGFLTVNISSLTGYVGTLTENLDIGPLMAELANITGNLELTLSNMTGDVDAMLNIVSEELDIVNEKVIDDFLSDSFATFSTQLNSNFSSLNIAITGFFNQLNIEILIGQIVNTCILGASFFFFWLYFSRFWPTNVDDLTLDKVIRSFGAPAVPLLIGSVFLEIIWIPFLIIEWGELQGVFVKNLVVVVPCILLVFLLLQFSLVLTYCVYLRIYIPFLQRIESSRLRKRLLGAAGVSHMMAVNSNGEEQEILETEKKKINDREDGEERNEEEELDSDTLDRGNDIIFGERGKSGSPPADERSRLLDRNLF